MFSIQPRDILSAWISIPQKTVEWIQKNPLIDIFTSRIQEVKESASLLGKDLTRWKNSFRPAPQFSKYFFDQLKKNNLEKKDAPLALILHAEYDDPNEAISGPWSEHLILQIAKTYRVAFKTIDRGSLFGQKIREASEENQKPISLLFVLAHGSPSRLRFGHFGFWNWLPNFRKSDLHEKDFAPLSTKAPIILDSCLAGQELAQEIANISKRAVLASREELTSVAGLFTTSGNDPRLLSYDENGKQHMHIFRPDASPELVRPVSAHFKKQFFAEEFDYIKKLESDKARSQFAIGELYSHKLLEAENSKKEALHWYRLAADQGDAYAQYNVGCFYLKGEAGLERSEKEAFHWFCLAANQGHAKSQYNVGFFCLKGEGRDLGKSDKEVLHWFRLAANQGHAKSQYNVGIFYLEGKGGLEKSEEEALYWLHLAADQGFAKAQLEVGDFYEKGLGGLEKSEEKALHWYRLAADQGDAEAKAAIQKINKSKSRSHAICKTLGGLYTRIAG